MNIGAADPEGTYSCTPGLIALRPGRERVVHTERSAGERNRGVGLTKIQGGGNRAMLEGQNGLQQPSHSGSRVQMTKIAFHRSHGNASGLEACLAIDLVERRNR